MKVAQPPAGRRPIRNRKKLTHTRPRETTRRPTSGSQSIECVDCDVSRGVWVSVGGRFLSLSLSHLLLFSWRKRGKETCDRWSPTNHASLRRLPSKPTRRLVTFGRMKASQKRSVRGVYPRVVCGRKSMEERLPTPGTPTQATHNYRPKGEMERDVNQTDGR